jgi:hypothetical protein
MASQARERLGRNEGAFAITSVNVLGLLESYCMARVAVGLRLDVALD